MLDPLTFVGDGIFDGEDTIIFGDGHATDVVELACSSDAIAAPLVEKAAICIEVLDTVRVHISNNQSVIGKRVDFGDDVELAFANAFAPRNQLLFAITFKAAKTKLVSEPESVIGGEEDTAGKYPKIEACVGKAHGDSCIFTYKNYNYSGKCTSHIASERYCSTLL